MRRLLNATVAFAASAALLLTTARPAQANAYGMGMQWCQMVRSGMDASEAWNIIVNDYASGQPSMLNRGDPFAPWSPTRTWSGAIGAGVGAGIAGGIMAAFSLNRMKSDIIKTTDANCPEYGLYLGKRPTGAEYAPQVPVKSELDDPKHSSFCNWNPWAAECKGVKAKASYSVVKSCGKAIEKFECSYKKYLSANPSVEKWAKVNPVMAKKEAIRLGAVDAEEIALPVIKEASAKAVTTLGAKDIENKCLKAADFKGCMEYSLKR